MKKGSKLERDPQKLESELERLRNLTSEELRERWQTLFGDEPPPKLRSSLIVQGLPIAFRRKPWQPSSRRPYDCWSALPMTQPHVERLSQLPQRFA